MRLKIERPGTERKVVYDESRWALLEELRGRAAGLLRILGGDSYVYGSVARGDVHRGSDVDIVVLDGRRPMEVESLLLSKGIEPRAKEVVMATPNSLPKGHIHLGENTTITIPLVRPSPREEEFYRFGGLASRRELEEGVRVPGVDKRLMMILPMEYGHLEFSILGREAEASRILGVSEELVRERVRVLTRRDRIGRTGVFLRREIPLEEDLGEAFERLADKSAEIKRFLRKRL